MPYGPAGPDPYTQWMIEQERIRRRRLRMRIAVGGVVGVVLVAAVAAGAVLGTGGGGSDGGDRDSAGRSPAPSGTPSTHASLLSRPVIRAEQAFPEKSVLLKDGSRYERVDLATTTDCAQGMSPELASLAEMGEGCLRLTSALFTDHERRSQVTVSVVSFRRAEDAWLVFGTAAMDPVTYQVVSLDPPPSAGLPTVPPGSAGVFRRLATVRSVVFANGQWGDGSETEEAEITRQTEGLLQYVNDTVVAYEGGGSGGS
ncbi:hypothetical protein AQJ91_00680 [Streptomyces dysideae]|uniref:Uncharacterized protein n=2 Tax=Streptomyces dysideae TaxID=909626 RepID=A0A124IG11_9ACTN|nr:hypothetical protein AQJ91_00680 [Streptomyces dysideae]